MIEEDALSARLAVLQKVALMWAELLNVEDVPRDATLLELGGNSLTVMMLANRIEEEFGLRPSLELLFMCTLEELVSLCAGSANGQVTNKVE